MEKNVIDITKENQHSEACKELVWICRDCSNIITDSIEKADEIINNKKYKKILVSISGGSDSDDVLDLCSKLDTDNKCIYIWFDTGLEYQATKEHLTYLEYKYHIQIVREKPIKPIPISCKEYGQPFISKYVSEFISRLQHHNFKWEDEPYEVLIKKYPNCSSALGWWCNYRKMGDKNSWFDIHRNSYLKEFMIANPPTFNVSNKCCDFAKKHLAHNAIKKYNADLNIMGVRFSEGGIRANAYKKCFTEGKKIDDFRPIWWWNNDDKSEYENCVGVSHSNCYTIYGLPRTGCVGCPFARDLETELEIIEKYEPKLFKAVSNVFSDSYEYRKKYKEFVKEMKEKGIKPRKD